MVFKTVRTIKMHEMHTGRHEKLDAVIPLLKDGISQKNSLVFTVISTSMEPILSAGDKLYASTAIPVDITCGDIVIFKLGEQLVSHRVVTLQDTFVVTKGDNNLTVDKPIPRNMIIAKIHSVDTHAGTVDFNSTFWKITNKILAKISYWHVFFANKKLRACGIQIITFLSFALNPKLALFILKKNRPFDRYKEMIIRLCDKDTIMQDPHTLYYLIHECSDWNYMLSFILYNNVGSLIYENLRYIDATCIPSWVMDTLEQNYHKTCQRMKSAYRDLDTLLEEFQHRVIPVIVLKGAAIAPNLYTHIGLRPMEDIDLLIKKENWPAVRTITERAGFSSSKNLDLLTLEERAHITMDWHIDYQNKSGTKIEYKFNLFALDFPCFSQSHTYWNHAQKEIISNKNTLTLCDEDHFLLLTVRTMNVGFRNFLWFYELREFIRLRTLNWHTILDNARTTRTTTILYYVLRILKEKLLADGIPEDILAKLKPRPCKERFLDMLFGYKDAGFRKPRKRHKFRYHMIRGCFMIEKCGFDLKNTIEIFHHIRKTLFPSIPYICYRYGIPRWQAYVGFGYAVRLLQGIRNQITRSS